jgi:colicin import membrane protein
MRETRADTAHAVTLAVLLHVLLALLVFVGLRWTREPAPAAAGEPIAADLFDPNALPAAMRRSLAERPEPPVEPPPPEPIEEQTAPPPQPVPEPNPQDSPVEQQDVAQEQIPDPDPIDQDEVRRDALAAETAEREQEEKRRQEQIDLTERERQEEAEKRQRLSEMEEERQKQLADIRKQRALAARDAKLAEEKLKQLADRRARTASEEAAVADASASAPPGNRGVDPSLLGAYQAALQEAILRNWTRPETVPLGQRCRLEIRQLPGGEVVDVSVSPSCPYDELGKRSVEAAVLKAQPLPYAGFEAVFSRTLNLNFEAQDR